MDDEIVTLFNQLNHGITKIVKKHFTKPLRSTGGDVVSWKDYKPLTPENRELWVRALIADDLYAEFFSRKQSIFGLDPEREDAMKDFEMMLEESHKGQFLFV